MYPVISLWAFLLEHLKTTIEGAGLHIFTWWSQIRTDTGTRWHIETIFGHSILEFSQRIVNPGSSRGVAV